MDEFAIQKGHRYATVIVEPYRKRVLWVGRGRGRLDVRPFFEMLGVQGRQRLRAVCMDMSPAFTDEVRFQCPDAEIVYDLFHVLAKYGRDLRTANIALADPNKPRIEGHALYAAGLRVRISTAC